MQYTIITYPDKTLRKISKPVTVFDSALVSFCQALKETMIQKDGVGLASIQIGIPKSIIVIKTENGPEVFINPTITSFSALRDIDTEACLSVPGVIGEVSRSRKIKLQAQDITGKKLNLNASGFLARVFQHEIDHTNGILFIDKAIKINKAPADFAFLAEPSNV